MDFQTKILFLGSSDCTPDVGNDSACVLINDKYLFDTGWASLVNLRRLNIDPADFDHIFFTHMHRDHYLSFPAFIYYYLRVKKPLENMKIFGPAADVSRVVNLSIAFLQESHRSSADCPLIREMSPQDSYENDDIRITTCPTLHQVPCLSYRVFDKNTGRTVSISGDTAYSPVIVEHVRNSDVLIHDAGFGPEADNLSSKTKSLHSTAEDAGRVANESNAGRLFLVHVSGSKAKNSVLSASKYYSSGEVCWPEPNSVYKLSRISEG